MTVSQTVVALFSRRLAAGREPLTKIFSFDKVGNAEIVHRFRRELAQVKAFKARRSAKLCFSFICKLA